MPAIGMRPGGEKCRRDGPGARHIPIPQGVRIRGPGGQGKMDARLPEQDGDQAAPRRSAQKSSQNASTYAAAYACTSP